MTRAAESRRLPLRLSFAAVGLFFFIAAALGGQGQTRLSIPLPLAGSVTGNPPSFAPAPRRAPPILMICSAAWLLTAQCLRAQQQDGRPQQPQLNELVQELVQDYQSALPRGYTIDTADGLFRDATASLQPIGGRPAVFSGTAIAEETILERGANPFHRHGIPVVLFRLSGPAGDNGDAVMLVPPIRDPDGRVVMQALSYYINVGRDGFTVMHEVRPRADGGYDTVRWTRDSRFPAPASPIPGR